ncbi:Na+/H+ antiporter subunit B [Chitinophaga alhagiae]|uniref:Na+/H+ antiporter subunit B n=1 Tax=Chitinophaga alhagiae TaxID=2203219 RepID=UPI000E5B629D|nr:Na+/H+ antiporter subunit B [Chitinophaga alhagiae]
MKSVILRTASNYLLPLLLLFSVFILLRGHYNPGGGFVGGLIASIAFMLHAFANQLENTRKLLRYPPGALIPVGLAVSLLSGLAPVFAGQPFMTALWFSAPVPIIGLVGTPLFFDIGVYFVVIGITLTILFNISENIL